MSESFNIIVEDQQNINISVSEFPVDINVGLVGMQGPIGPSGSNGGGVANLNNVVFTTGNQNISGIKNFYDSIYTSGNLILGSTGYIDFTSLTTLPNWKIGRVFYDSANDSLSYYNSINGVTVNLGKEQIIDTVNAENNTILNGTIVYVSGARGNNPEIYRATNLFSNNVGDKVLGIATHDINTNTVGYITSFGIVHDLDTQAYNEGDFLYLGTGGQFISSPPRPPNHVVRVGWVNRQHPNQGEIFVNIRVLPSLEELHTVNLTGIVSGQTLVYNSNTFCWENRDIIFPYQTGQFYPASNPQQHISSGDADNKYATIVNLGSTGQNLQSQINSLTSTTGNYYPRNNPSGYITGFNSGIYINTGQTGQFYAASNPNQFIRSGDVSVLYYTKNNESGFLNSLSGLSTGYVQSISGAIDSRLQSTGSNLQSQINSITAGTGAFYLSSNPQSFSSSGNVANTGQQAWNAANNNAINLSGNLQSTGSNLYSLISAESNKPTITGISITGGNSITGIININAGSNITLTQAGNNTFSIASTSVGGSNITNAVTGFGTNGYIAKFAPNGSGILNSILIDNGNNSLQFGGTTNSFPSIKISGQNLALRLADDSNFTNLSLNELQATGNIYTSGIFVGNLGAGSTNYKTQFDGRSFLVSYIDGSTRANYQPYGVIWSSQDGNAQAFEIKSSTLSGLLIDFKTTNSQPIFGFSRNTISPSNHPGIKIESTGLTPSLSIVKGDNSDYADFTAKNINATGSLSSQNISLPITGNIYFNSGNSNGIVIFDANAATTRGNFTVTRGDNVGILYGTDTMLYAAGGKIGFGNSDFISQGDVFLSRDGANTLSLRNQNLANSPQSYRIYNVTGLNTGEFGRIGWDTSNNLIIGAEAYGSGLLRNVRMSGKSFVFPSGFGLGGAGSYPAITFENQTGIGLSLSSASELAFRNYGNATQVLFRVGSANITDIQFGNVNGRLGAVADIRILKTNPTLEFTNQANNSGYASIWVNTNSPYNPLLIGATGGILFSGSNVGINTLGQPASTALDVSGLITCSGIILKQYISGNGTWKSSDGYDGIQISNFGAIYLMGTTRVNGLFYFGGVDDTQISRSATKTLALGADGFIDLGGFAAGSFSSGIRLRANNIIASGNLNITSGIGISPNYSSGNNINLGNSSFYIHTGYSNDTWILPTASSSPGRFYFLKNKGANITLTGNSNTESLFTNQLVLKMAINSGESYIAASDGVNQWMIM